MIAADDTNFDLRQTLPRSSVHSPQSAASSDRMAVDSPTKSATGSASGGAADCDHRSSSSSSRPRSRRRFSRSRSRDPYDAEDREPKNSTDRHYSSSSSSSRRRYPEERSYHPDDRHHYYDSHRSSDRDRGYSRSSYDDRDRYYERSSSRRYPGDRYDADDYERYDGSRYDDRYYDRRNRERERDYRPAASSSRRRDSPDLTGLGRPAPVPDLPQQERDQRTVFVAQLHIQARPRDIADFFEKHETGQVRDVKLVADRGSRRGKGVGFVEFYELESVDKALACAGQLLLGVPIIVERTESEKNRLALAAAAEKSKLLAQANAAVVPGMRSLSTASGSSNAVNGDGVSPTLGKGLSKGPPSLPPRPPSLPDRPDHAPNAGANGSAFGAQQSANAAKTLYVEKLPVNLATSDIRQIFEPFGPVENVSLVLDPLDGKPNGTALVHFREPNGCQIALLGMKGFTIGEHVIQCRLHSEVLAAAAAAAAITAAASEAAGGEAEELEEKPGMRLNAQSRAELMAKLARAKNVDVPHMSPSSSAAAPGAGSASANGHTASSSSPIHIQMPARCILLTNLFDPATETEPNWDREIEEDVKVECERMYGPVRHIHLVKASQGVVYVKFANVESATKAIAGLNGRMFSGNQVSATYMSESEYNDKFPAAASL